MEDRVITDERIDQYCLWLYDNEKSSRTIRKYRYYLQLFQEYLDGKAVNKEKVIRWKNYLKQKFAGVTVNVVLAAMNGFFKYWCWRDCIAKFVKIRRSLFYPEKKEISREEYKRLVKAARDQGNKRLALLLQTVCSTGIRISELRYITVEVVKQRIAEVECKGRALGVLSVTKVVNRAPAGTTFYFTVVNSKGERMKMPDENGNPTAEDIWYLTVTDPITSSAVVGTRTLRNIPYDTYTVTETKSDGEPLNKGYAYKVSYETTTLGETTKTQTGTITIADPMMSVTVTNTKSSGGGGGGKDPGPDPTKPDPTTPDPTNPDPTTPNPGDSSGGDNVPPNIITDGLIPLGGGYYRNPVDGSIIYIGDEGVPLALAKAGDRGSAVEVALLLASVMGIAILLLVRHRKKQSSGD